MGLTFTIDFFFAVLCTYAIQPCNAAHGTGWAGHLSVCCWSSKIFYSGQKQVSKPESRQAGRWSTYAPFVRPAEPVVLKWEIYRFGSLSWRKKGPNNNSPLTRVYNCSRWWQSLPTDATAAEPGIEEDLDPPSCTLRCVAAMKNKFSGHSGPSAFLPPLPPVPTWMHSWRLFGRPSIYVHIPPHRGRRYHIYISSPHRIRIHLHTYFLSLLARC